MNSDLKMIKDLSAVITPRKFGESNVIWAARA